MTAVAETNQPLDPLVGRRGYVGGHAGEYRSGGPYPPDMDLVRLGIYYSTTEANLVKARLESEGIDAVVQADDLGATTPMLGNVRGVLVLVREEERAAAMEILERMLPSSD